MYPAVCVAGIGCICAAGDTLQQAVDSMLRAERHLGAAPIFATTHAEPYPVFPVKKELSHYAFSSAGMRYMRTANLGLEAAHQAIEQSGIDIEQLRTLKVGVCMGTTVGSSMDVEAFYADYRQGATPDMRPIDCFYNSNPAAVISTYFGFNGPQQTIVNACSSGTDAIGTAAMWLRNGCCDVVLAGGADELCRTTYNGFAALQISSPQPCSPFSAERSGLNLGEGAAVLVLARAEVIKQLALAQPYGYVLGYGSGSDGWHLTAPHPEGRGLQQAVHEAIADCADVSGRGVTLDRLAFVNTHGTGTKDNDRVEGLVLAQLLPKTPFHSTKGYTGHTLGAAGAIEAALTLEFLQRQQIPASAGFNVQDPAIALSPVTSNTSFTGNIALSESLAFGGNNAALILGIAEAS
ncbi:MAG: beta-ketoacyl-[acyl-carrier-protein] synthase family protein [Desulfuromonas sp.]|nr:beta-ketoacyl-[acyl-carrier-protein] synthase family protein [Desulfuromonas sp.]